MSESQATWLSWAMALSSGPLSRVRKSSDASMRTGAGATPGATPGAGVTPGTGAGSYAGSGPAPGPDAIAPSDITSPLPLWNGAAVPALLFDLARLLPGLYSHTAPIVPGAAELEFPDHWWGDIYWAALREADRDREAARIVDRAVEAGKKAGKPHDPPAEGELPPPLSAENDIRADIEAMLARRTLNKGPWPMRSVAEVLAQADTVAPLFGRAALADPRRKPTTWMLLARAELWVVPYVMRAKYHYHRARPIQYDLAATMLIDCPPHPSYPSGHATQAFLLAQVLGECAGLGELANLGPLRKVHDTWARPDIKHPGALIVYELAERIATNREYAGVHVPSETRAGHQLSRLLFPHYRGLHAALFEAAKHEWYQKPPPPPTPTISANA